MGRGDLITKGYGDLAAGGGGAIDHWDYAHNRQHDGRATSAAGVGRADRDIRSPLGRGRSRNQPGSRIQR